METILNLVWVIVALAAVGLCFTRRAKYKQDTRARVICEMIAIGCVVLLLFPVISLTDDLHPEVVAVDSASGKRGGASLLAHAARPHHSTPKTGISFLAVLPPPAVTTLKFGAAGCFVSSSYGPENWHGSLNLGRAPPSLT
jgi:hypothetical protein